MPLLKPINSTTPLVNFTKFERLWPCYPVVHIETSISVKDMMHIDPYSRFQFKLVHKLLSCSFFSLQLSHPSNSQRNMVSYESS